MQKSLGTRAVRLDVPKTPIPIFGLRLTWPSCRYHKYANTLFIYSKQVRASVFIIACVVIIAVDFDIFPRIHAKTGQFGYSLMDMGNDKNKFIFIRGNFLKAVIVIDLGVV